MKHKKKYAKTASVVLALGTLSCSALADEKLSAMQVHLDDDSTADSQTAQQEATETAYAFKADMERMASEKNMPNVASNATTSASGIRSAVIGLSGMKTLVAKINDDGTVSYTHVGDAEEAKSFLTSETDTTSAEEE